MINDRNKDKDKDIGFIEENGDKYLGYELPTPTTPEKDVYQDAIGKALREQNYKAFLDTAMQRYGMKTQSEKYLQNELAQKGLASQGYGTTAHLGIGNTAMNLYAKGMADYNRTEQEIALAEQERGEQKQLEQDNQLVGFIQNAINYGADDTMINKYLQNYGYLDANGNYTEKWNNLSDESKAYINSVIAGKDLFDDEETQADKEIAGSLGTEYVYNNKIPYYDIDGNIQQGKNQFKFENEALEIAIAKGEIALNTYIVLQNGSGGYLYLYRGKDGKLYNISHETYYKNATDDNSYYFKWNGKSGRNVESVESGKGKTQK